jgi:hypothetical protein
MGKRYLTVFHPGLFPPGPFDTLKQRRRRKFCYHFVTVLDRYLSAAAYLPLPTSKLKLEL